VFNCSELVKYSGRGLGAVVEEEHEYPDDKAAIIVTFERSLVIDLCILFLFYDGPEPPSLP
jgi:hypothetical protein